MYLTFKTLNQSYWFSNSTFLFLFLIIFISFNFITPPNHHAKIVSYVIVLVNKWEESIRMMLSFFSHFPLSYFHYEPPHKLKTILIASFSLSFSFSSLYSSTSLTLPINPYLPLVLLHNSCLSWTFFLLD